MNYDTFRTITQLQTLAWTIPMIVLCFIVLWEIRRPTYDACFSSGGKKTQMCWILFGLFFAFIGKVFEAAFWAVPWTLAYIEHPRWFEFNSYGVFFNAIFRQGAFTIAAYCHLRAFISPKDHENSKNGLRTVHWILGASLILGQLYMLLLLHLKPLGS